MEKLNISCDYGACLWIDGRAINPDQLPISNTLCEEIIEFIEDYSQLTFKNGDNKLEWQQFFEREIIIAKKLKQELPDVQINIWKWNRWIELEKSLFQIEIIDEISYGPNFLIFPTSNQEYDSYKNKKMGITLDEDNFVYIYWFLLPYFDWSIQNRDFYFIQDKEFDWYDDNYFIYNSIRKFLYDLKTIVTLLIDHPHSNKLIKFKQNLKEYGFYLFQQKFYPNMIWNDLSDNEKEDFINQHNYVFIDFYLRFIEKMEILMRDNPNEKFICFSGP
ncbi:hypothetical protein QV01_03060 [Gallibacterium genomosp. 3]|uniref:Uncharacterized protein n=1 Tax=Gallibacterium genomosp. 3 TaxID=505345 RepID=A0A1A7NVQ5_9PAST|nr:hypothetical protein [Gallibacterium genomosp. 3]OBW93084.1 hypothetical protein QV01_03060 [Gallibacterium genomosp. 3]